MNHEDSTHLLCKIIPPAPLSAEIQAQLSRFSQPDWDDFLRLADQHRLLPLLQLRLSPLSDAVALPEDVRIRLQDTFLINTAHNMLLSHHAGEIIGALTAAGIPVIGLKGVYLLNNFYANIGERVLSDLDLLVPAVHIPAAITIMQAFGFEQTTYFSPQDDNPDIKHVPPYLKPGGPYVELHWSIVEDDWGFSVETQGLWDRAVPARIAGVEALALSLEDLLLHLCIHCTYQHGLRGGLRALYDFVPILDRHSAQVDWDALAARAHAWGVSRVVWLTLSMVNELFGLKTPQNTMKRLLGGTEDPAILAEARAQVLQTSFDGQVSMTPDLASFAATPGLIGKLRVVLARVFIPKKAMARRYNIPPKSIRLYLYYPLRFWQLFLTYARSAWGVMQGQTGALESAARENANQGLLRWMEER